MKSHVNKISKPYVPLKYIYIYVYTKIFYSLFFIMKKQEEMTAK